MANTRRYRLELPAPPKTADPAQIQKYLSDIRRLSMDEFNRLAGDFYDFRQEVIDSSTVPLASVAAISVTTTAFSAVFNWENPAQTQGVPTHVRVRIAEFGDTWAEYTYPINTWTAFGLNPDTAYTFQIQLVRRASSTVSFISALRNCPSLPVQVESLSEIRSRGFTTSSGLGPPTDDGGGDSVFPIPDTPGTPGPPGGANCWWEWQIQIVNLTTGEWSDTIYSGTAAGNIGNIVFDISVLDPLRLYRMKYREVCNGVPGPWLYGNPFTGGSDWLANCGGNLPSNSILVAPYSDADLFAIPYLCMTAGAGVRIREYLSGIEIIPQFGYNLTFRDATGEWNMLADIWDNSLTTKPLGSTVLPALMDLDNSDDVSIGMEIWMIDLPTNPPGGFGTGNVLNIGDGRIQFNVTYNNLGIWGVQFTAVRENGGTFILNSTLTYPIGFSNDKVLILVTLDQDGDKILHVNGVAVATDSTGEEVRLDGMSGHLQINAFSNMFLSKLYGWNRVLDEVEIGIPEFPDTSGSTWFRWEALDTAITGNPISALDDIGGELDLVQATLANRPTLVPNVTPAFHQAIDFDGVNDYMVNTNEEWNVNTQHTHGYFLVNPNRAAGSTFTIWSWADDGTTGGPGIASIRLTYNPATNQYTYLYVSDDGVTRFSVSADASTSGWDFVICHDDGPGSGARIAVYGGDSDSVGSYVLSGARLTTVALGAAVFAVPVGFADMQLAAAYGYEIAATAEQETDLIQYVNYTYGLEG